MIKLKHILTENMRRFGTKNLLSESRPAGLQTLTLSGGNIEINGTEYEADVDMMFWIGITIEKMSWDRNAGTVTMTASAAGQTIEDATMSAGTVAQIMQDHIAGKDEIFFQIPTEEGKIYDLRLTRA